MSDENGNGDGDFVTYGIFNQFKENSAVLCREYRSHVSTKIEGVEKKLDSVEESISSKIKLVGAVLGIIVTILTVINVYLSVIM